MPSFEINGRTYAVPRLQQELPRLDLIDWLERHPIYPKVFWKDRDGPLARAAVGSLLTFPQVPRISGNDPLRLYGGIRFADARSDDTTWQGFPKTCFWLPEIELTDDGEKTEAIVHSQQEYRSLEPFSFGTPELLERKDTPSFAAWKTGVDAALEAIASGNLDKLVLARRTSLYFSGPVDIWATLRQLVSKAPRATLFAFQLSPTLCFLGASPEKLFTRSANTLHTDVLAGTRRRGKSDEEDLKLENELLGSGKEQREFGIVKTYLANAVSALAHEIRWESEDKILKTPNVQHLHNRLHARLKETTSDEALIKALHPTPALGGFPREKALSYLKEIEPFDRGWYGAPVGMVGTHETSLAVAIRSALIDKNCLHLFSGAGLVAGSRAESEWEELEHKIKLFKDLLQSGVNVA